MIRFEFEIRTLPLIVFSLLLCLPSEVVFGQSANPFASAPPKELTEALGKFEKRREVVIEAPVGDQIDKLHKKYLGALDQTLKAVYQRGELEPAQELKAEKERIINNVPIDFDQPLIFPDTIRLRKTLVVEYQRIIIVQKSLEARLAQEMSKYLTSLQSQLVQKGRVEDAAKIKAYRESSQVADFAKNKMIVHLVALEQAAPVERPQLVKRLSSSSDSESSKAGPLRAFCVVTQNGYRDLDISKAEGITDFVTVALLSHGDWAAVRRNGRVVSNVKDYSRLRDVARVYKNGYYLTKAGVLDSVSERGFRRIRDVVQADVTHKGGIALKVDGTVAVFGATPEPPEPLVDIAAVSLNWGGYVVIAIKESGESVVWGTGKTQAISQVTFSKGPLQIDSGWRSFLVKSQDGSVLQFPENPTLTPPKARAIKAQCNVFAVQQDNLRWIAWGDGVMGVLDKINKSGPAIDIDFEVNGRGHGYLLWISVE